MTEQKQERYRYLLAEHDIPLIFDERNPTLGIYCGGWSPELVSERLAALNSQSEGVSIREGLFNRIKTSIREWRGAYLQQDEHTALEADASILIDHFRQALSSTEKNTEQPTTSQEYGFCPFCFSHDVSDGHEYMDRKGVVHEMVGCNRCGASAKKGLWSIPANSMTLLERQNTQPSGEREKIIEGLTGMINSDVFNVPANVELRDVLIGARAHLQGGPEK